jgi:hypothetical protein
MKIYRLASMSASIRNLTAVMFCIPIAMAVGAMIMTRYLVGPLVIVCLAYAWVWLRFRPTAFIIHSDTLETIWPLKRREIQRGIIRSCRLISLPELKREAGICTRVGAGGLWGGFGWLWTQRRGIVQMYISRTNNMVWIECWRERPWLITPERPEEFIQELSQFGQRAQSD